MKHLKTLILSLVLLLAIAGFFPLKNRLTLNAVYSGEVVNNVIYVTYNDGSDDWINDIPYGYTNDIKTIMSNSYNDSTSSVNAYYKTMSFNSLNLTSSFYTDNEFAYTVPYNKNQLLTYSPTNTQGYFEYEICTYSTSYAPSFLSSGYLMTTHEFNCYECDNSNKNGMSSRCDMDITDGIGCYCAYLKFAEENLNTVKYTHLEEYVREQISVQSVLKQISSFSGNIDSDNDGYIDAMTFIFPEAEGVDWSDLLWAHQFEILTLGNYLPSNYQTPTMLLSLLQMRGVRNETENSVSVLLDKIKISNKTCQSYNLYLFSDLVDSSRGVLKGADNKEISKVFTLAHELGHVIGLPDYYTYDSETNEEDPLDVWDLMGYSYYSAPTYMTTYNREILGFTNSNNVVKLEESGTYSLKPTCYDEIHNNNNNSNNVLAYVLEDPNYPDQKIYLEYRYKGGVFEPNYPYKSNGLIIYRIDNNITQVDGYDSSLSAGNYFSYPFNMYVFRNNNTYAFNDYTNSFGNANKSSTQNAITFQTYDTSKDQSELKKSDITFVNSTIVIENITINSETNEISFKISGGYLKEPAPDLTDIKLIGNTTVNHNVNQPYVDQGINFGEFNQDDLEISTQNNVNINTLGEYTFVYTITHKQTNESITLIRKVNVIDNVKPEVQLIGDDNIVLSNISQYSEQGITYSDNYYPNNQLMVITSKPGQVSYGNMQIWKVEYKVMDPSGNETIIYRTINIYSNAFDGIEILGGETVNHEVLTPYIDLGLRFSGLGESNFSVITDSNVNNEILGQYFYTYTITFLQTNQTKTLTRYVNIVDTTAPTITLNRGSYVQVYKSQFNNFEEPGFTAIDNYDYMLTTRITKSVINERKYVLTYYACDNSGNEATLTRTVEMVAKPLNEIDNNMKITVVTSSKKLFSKTLITIKFTYELLDDNLIDENNLPNISFYINSNLIDSENNQAIVKFQNPGVYTVKVAFGNIQITKNLDILDINQKKENNTALTTLIVILGVIGVGVIGFVISKNKANKVKKKLDRY